MQLLGFLQQLGRAMAPTHGGRQHIFLTYLSTVIGGLRLEGQPTAAN
jgi:hypothetical protein